MQENLPTVSAFTYTEEGGYSSDPNDSGNYAAGVLIGSNFGVSAAELVAWMAPAKVTAQTMRALTMAQAQPIYAVRYWQAMSCDTLPGGVEALVCDFGYNAGAQTSGYELQALVGADQDGWIGSQTVAACGQVDAASLARGLSSDAAKVLQDAIGATADGQVGPMTLAALAKTGPGATLALCCALYDAHVAHYRTLAQFSLYGADWVARAGRCLALAVKLAGVG